MEGEVICVLLLEDPFGFDETFVPDENVFTPDDLIDIEHMIESVQGYAMLFDAIGIKGVGFNCDDCGQVHFQTWGEKIKQLEHIRESHACPSHEFSKFSEEELKHFVPLPFIHGFIAGMVCVATNMQEEKSGERCVSFVIPVDTEKDT